MRKLWALLALSVMVVASACGGDSDDSSGSVEGGSSDRESIRIMSASFSVGHGLTLLAVDGGFFDANGLDAELINGEGAANALAAVVSGSVEVYAGEPSAAYAASQQKEMLMPIRSYSGSAISLTLSQKAVDESGLTLDSPLEDRLEALDGLTIATVSEGGSTITLNDAVATVGASVKNTYLEQGSYVAALQSDRIDGFVGSAPFGQIAEAEGIGVDWIRGPLGEWPTNDSDYFQVGVGFTNELAERNPEMAAKIIKSYIDAAAFIEEKPDEARVILADRFTDMESEIWELVWETAVEAAVFTSPIPEIGAYQFTYDAYVSSLDDASDPPVVDLEKMRALDLVGKAKGES